jgi:hypothetical protein
MRSCRRFDLQANARLPDLAAPNAGIKIAISRAMIEMTISSSIKVNASLQFRMWNVEFRISLFSFSILNSPFFNFEPLRDKDGKVGVVDE